MVVIIDYDVGNLESLQRGCDRAGISTVISNDPLVIQDADTLILPGVGAFPDAMKSLQETGLIPLIKDHVQQGKYLIGICLGMQLLCTSSDEFGYTKGLDFIPGTITQLQIPYKVPHMGWNNLEIVQKDPIVQSLTNEDYVYFVHSYYAICDPKYIVSQTEYGVQIPAIIRHKNVIGMQFHPEKSGAVGLRILQNIKEMIV